ncbi:MAG: PQQ-binding-like beta-propeller repeat protein [Planctomycetota bacterium]
MILWHRSILSLTLGVACLLAVSGAVADQAQETPDWPHPRGGLSGNGVAVGVELADHYEPAWVFETGGAVLSSPTIVDGVVYVGSEDKHLYAIDGASGQLKWKFEAKTLIDASPVVVDGVVYVGTDGGVLHAIRAETGAGLWAFEAEGRISGEAGVTNLTTDDGEQPKVVLAGSHDGLLYCLDAETGAKRWSYETGDYINCGITLDRGTIVLGGCDTYLHLIDLNTGEGRGEVALGGEVAGTPALANGFAYLGHMQNEVVAVNLETKEVAWRFTDRNFPYVGAPALAGDRLLIGSRGRRLYCLDRNTGEQLWGIRTQGGVEGGPVIAGERAIFGSAGGRVSIINITNGQTVWQHDLGASISVSPAVVPWLVVVGSEDGKVYAFKPVEN